jgi:glycosyltransferase involved in cell wall biosynthesis
MKRITVVTQYYKPEIGAPQNRLLEMVIGLKKYGWEVSVVTAMPNYPKGEIFKNYRGKLFYNEKVDEIDVLRTWLYASNSKKAIPRILSMLSFSLMALFSLRFLLKRKPDIILVESPPLTLGVTGVILSKLVGAKFVFNVSDLWPLSAKELGAISDGFFYRFLEKVEHFLYSKASVCLGQSSEIVDYIKGHGAKKVYLFRNGVAPERFKAIRDVDKKPKTLVYAGLLGVAQGICDICKGVDFRSLGVDFHIYGDGREKDEICESGEEIRQCGYSKG